MNGILAIAILSIAAGTVVMILGIVAKRSLEVEAKHKALFYNRSTSGRNELGTNSRAENTAFRAASMGADGVFDVASRTSLQQAISAGKSVL